MRLVYPEYEICIELGENIINVICIEHPKIFRKFIYYLWEQYKGTEGPILLSSNNTVLNIEKNVEIIANPFEININQKKIINNLYNELRTITMTQFADIVQQINILDVSYFDQLINELPYHLSYNVELKIIDLFKMYDLRLEYSSDSLLEKLIDYITLSSQICKSQLFIFINLKSYFNDEEIKYIYEVSIYNKLYFLLIENVYKEPLQNEQILIIDKDMCKIEV